MTNKNNCETTFYNGRVNRIYNVKKLDNGLIQIKIFIQVDGCFGLYRTLLFKKDENAYFNGTLLRWKLDPIFDKMRNLSLRDRTIFLAWRRLQLFNNPRNDASLKTYLNFINNN